MGVRYLGEPGSKKWILAMDGGENERPAASQKMPFP
jgi:phytochrome-interacting factor 4